ncbi:MAG: hypothetical protein WCP21_08655, partial [Armatimonadota bacterium]
PFEYRSTARYNIDMPAVQATAWLSEDNSLGIAVVNASDQRREVTVELPLKDAGLPTNAKLRLRALNPEGPGDETAITDPSVALRIPPDSALFLVIARR